MTGVSAAIECVHVLQVAMQRNFCHGPFSNPNAHATRGQFSFDQWQPPDYRAHYAEMGFLEEPANVDASPQAAWWQAKRVKPLLVVHNKFATARPGLQHPDPHVRLGRGPAC